MVNALCYVAFAGALNEKYHVRFILLSLISLLSPNNGKAKGRSDRRITLTDFYLEFTLNPLLLRSRGIDEEGSQSLTRVILRPISQT